MAIKIKVTAYGKPRSENGKVTGMGTAKVTTKPLIRRCLSNRPGDRPSAEQAHEEIKRFLAMFNSILPVSNYVLFVIECDLNVYFMSRGDGFK